MSQFYSIDTAFSAERAMMYRKGDRIPLAKRDNFRPQLHPRPLLRQDELMSSGSQCVPMLPSNDHYKIVPYSHF